MSSIAADDFKDGSSFFGFMGVSMALVLASIILFYLLLKILEPLMEQQKLVQELVVFQYGDLQ
jgi:hypothetical protein